MLFDGTSTITLRKIFAYIQQSSKRISVVINKKEEEEENRHIKDDLFYFLIDRFAIKQQQRTTLTNELGNGNKLMRFDW